MAEVQDNFSGKRSEQSLIDNLDNSISNTQSLIKNYGKLENDIIQVTGKYYEQLDLIMPFKIYYANVLLSEINTLLKADVPSHIPASLKIVQIKTRKKVWLID